MKDKKINSKNMLKFFDQNIEDFELFSPKIKDISDLVKGASLMLKQMKLVRKTAIELKKNFTGSDEEFQKKALEELKPVVGPVQKELQKTNAYNFNSALFALPGRKGRIFFEIVNEAEEIGKLPLGDHSRRERLDKNMEKMESFVEFLKEHQKKFDVEREKVIKSFNNKQTKILQIKISIKGIKPIIWRRFLVKDSITFHQFHKIIQKVMGWANYHLYAFEIGNLRIESEELAAGEYSDFEPSEKIRLSQVLSEKMKLEYVYDFGDCWEHTIKVEKTLEIDPKLKYPVCLAGERACPPEDCGSVPGYYNLMEIRENKKHPEYEEMIVNWLGEDYNPKEFDVDTVNKRVE